MHSIAIGCDPNGYAVKKELIKFLSAKGYEITDMGSDDPIYANVAFKVAEAVACGHYDRGILICGTGIGVCISANKVKGAYAALLTDVYSAERARKSNNANIACFGAFTCGIEHMKILAETFLTNEFISGCASQPKVSRIHEYDTVRR